MQHDEKGFFIFIFYYYSNILPHFPTLLLVVQIYMADPSR